jgi:hypothetical protein
MSLFCGDKCKCTRRGKSYFSGLPELERGFSKACDSNSKITKEEYLCSGRYIDQAQVILMYGYDPCPNNGVTPAQVLDPLNTQKSSADAAKQAQPMYLGIGILIAVGLLILWLINRKK